jgi:ribonuclease VapC
VIALDTSVIIALAFDEEDGQAISEFIAKTPSFVGTPTLVEVGTVLTRLDGDVAARFLSSFIKRRSVRTIDFDLGMMELARGAYRRYGKGSGHGAQLNFGDCFSYAVAKFFDAPLLFKGDDFAQTDLRSAWSP